MSNDDQVTKHAVCLFLAKRPTLRVSRRCSHPQGSNRGPLLYPILFYLNLYLCSATPKSHLWRFSTIHAFLEFEKCRSPIEEIYSVEYINRFFFVGDRCCSPCVVDVHAYIGGIVVSCFAIVQKWVERQGVPLTP
jgi:hypothetical protein